MFFKNKKIRPLRTAGDPVLGATALPVAAVTPEIRNLAAEMTEAVRAFNGIGLAAPQIGESLRMVVFDVPMPKSPKELTPGEELLLPRMPLTVINPEIISASGTLSEYDEGCLSVPDIFATVVRPDKVLFRATLLDGEVVECECGGLLGRCIQHELDHLDGLLFTDRLDPAESRRIAAPLEYLRKEGSKRNYLRKYKK